MRRLSCATSRFWATGFGRDGRAANLLWKIGADAAAAAAGIGEDWISRRTFGSRGESGGEAEGRIGLDDSGEDFAGRYGLDAVKVGRALAAAVSLSRKTGRGIVPNMVVFLFEAKGDKSCIPPGRKDQKKNIEVDAMTSWESD